MLHKLGLKDVPIRRAIVNDNAANAKKAIELADYLEQQLCVCHTLALAVSDILFNGRLVIPTTSKKTILRAKELAKFVNSSPKAKAQLVAACETLGHRYKSLKNSVKCR